MPSIITEGFLSKNPALITEGYAVLDELIYTGTGTILVSGAALSDGPIQHIYVGSGLVEIVGLAQSFYTSSFIFISSGTIIINGIATTEFIEEFIAYTASGEIIIKGRVSSQFIETIIGRIIRPEEISTFTDRLIAPSSYYKVKGKRTGIKVGISNYPDLYTKQQVASAKGKRTKYTGIPIYFSKKTKGKISHLEGDKTNYFDWISEKKKR